MDEAADHFKMLEWILRTKEKPASFAELFDEFTNGKKLHRSVKNRKMKAVILVLVRLNRVGGFTVNQIVHLYFILGRKVNKVFEKMFRGKGTLGLTGDFRISHYRSHDGTFERKLDGVPDAPRSGDHVAQPYEDSGEEEEEMEVEEQDGAEQKQDLEYGQMPPVEGGVGPPNNVADHEAALIEQINREEVDVVAGQDASPSGNYIDEVYTNSEEEEEEMEVVEQDVVAFQNDGRNTENAYEYVARNGFEQPPNNADIGSAEQNLVNQRAMATQQGGNSTGLGSVEDVKQEPQNLEYEQMPPVEGGAGPPNNFANPEAALIEQIKREEVDVAAGQDESLSGDYIDDIYGYDGGEQEIKVEQDVDTSQNAGLNTGNPSQNSEHQEPMVPQHGDEANLMPEVKQEQVDLEYEHMPLVKTEVVSPNTVAHPRVALPSHVKQERKQCYVKASHILKALDSLSMVFNFNGLEELRITILNEMANPQRLEHLIPLETVLMDIDRIHRGLFRGASDKVEVSDNTMNLVDFLRPYVAIMTMLDILPSGMVSQMANEIDEYDRRNAPVKRIQKDKLLRMIGNLLDLATPAL